MLSPPWFPLEGPFQERGPGLLEFPTAGPAPDSPDSQCIGGGEGGEAGQAGEAGRPAEEEETDAQSEPNWAPHLPGPGAAWDVGIDCVRRPA